MVSQHIAEHMALEGVQANGPQAALAAPGQQDDERLHPARRCWAATPNRGRGSPIFCKITPTLSSAGSIIAFAQHSADMTDGQTGLICSFGAGYSVGSVIVERRSWRRVTPRLSASSRSFMSTSTFCNSSVSSSRRRASLTEIHPILDRLVIFGHQDREALAERDDVAVHPGITFPPHGVAPVRAIGDLPAVQFGERGRDMREGGRGPSHRGDGIDGDEAVGVFDRASEKIAPQRRLRPARSTRRRRHNPRP